MTKDAGWERVSWREARPGMRLWQPYRGNPEILAIVPANRDTRRETGHPAAYACAAGWDFTPKGGFVKLMKGGYWWASTSGRPGS